jgi:hypothetical protein
MLILALTLSTLHQFNNILVTYLPFVAYYYKKLNLRNVEPEKASFNLILDNQCFYN